MTRGTFLPTTRNSPTQRVTNASPIRAFTVSEMSTLVAEDIYFIALEARAKVHRIARDRVIETLRRPEVPDNIMPVFTADAGAKRMALHFMIEASCKRHAASTALRA